jgi:hypothetical protein
MAASPGLPQSAASRLCRELSVPIRKLVRGPSTSALQRLTFSVIARAQRSSGMVLRLSPLLNPCSIHVARICRYSSEMPGKQREQTATWCDMNETRQRALSVDIVTDLALAGPRWRGLVIRAHTTRPRLSGVKNKFGLETSPWRQVMHRRPVDNVDSRVRSLKKMHGVLSRATLVRSRVSGAPARGSSRVVVT